MRKPGKIDTIGFGLMAVSLATLQIILDKGQQDDWFARPGSAGSPSSASLR